MALQQPNGLTDSLLFPLFQGCASSGPVASASRSGRGRRRCPSSSAPTPPPHSRCAPTQRSVSFICCFQMPLYLSHVTQIPNPQIYKNILSNKIDPTVHADCPCIRALLYYSNSTIFTNNDETKVAARKLFLLKDATCNHCIVYSTVEGLGIYDVKCTCYEA